MRQAPCSLNPRYYHDSIQASVNFVGDKAALDEAKEDAEFKTQLGDILRRRVKPG